MKRVICVILVMCFLVFPIKSNALSVSAKAAILINGDTGEILFEKNANSTLPMASTTKIMTALLLCEHGDLEREITVSAEMLRVEGTSMGLLPGDKVTLRGLLYGMLLASGNDAANVTAYTLGQTIDGFVKMMNDKADELGLENTNFETPSGLDGEEHYTTAKDLAKLAKFALGNKDFSMAAASKSAVLEYGNPPYKRTITNHNKLLKIYDGAVGVKTGFTKKSGRCLVSAAKRDGKFVIAVTLNDPNDWEDHKNLLNYGLDIIKVTEITPENINYEIPIISSKENLNVTVAPFKTSYVNEQDFSCEVNLPKFLYAPIKKGEIIGSVVYYKGEEKICKLGLKAEKEILFISQEFTFFDRFKENFIGIFKNIWES